MAEDLKTKVEIGGDTSGLTSAFTEAASRVREGASQMSEGLGQVRESLTKANEAFIAFGAGLGAVAGIAEFVHATVEAASSVRALSLATGGSVESASILKSALATIGASSDTYVGALDHLARQMKTNEDGINALGIATRNADGSTRDSQAVFSDALRAVQEYKPGLDQTQAAMYLFGRSVQDVRTLMPLLNVDMDEAKAKAAALGLVLSDEDVAAVNQYKVALNEGKEVVEGAFNAIGKQLIPVLTEMAKSFANAGPSIVEFARGVGDFLVGAIRVAVSVFQELSGVLQTWGTILATVGRIMVDVFSGREGWSRIKLDWQAGMSELDDISKSTAAKIKATWSDTHAAIGADPLAFQSGTKGFEAPEKTAKDLSGRDAVLRAQLAGEVAIVKEYVAEQDKELSRGYKDGLVALKDYYSQRLALTQLQLDTEIAAAEKMKESTQAQGAAAAAKGDDKGVQAALAQQIGLETQLTVLRQRRAAAAVLSAQEEADAETKLANQVALAHAQANEKVRNDALDAQHAIIAAEASAGQITGAQAIEAFRNIEKQKYDIAVEFATKRAALETDQVKAQQELGDKLAAIRADYEKKDTEIAVQNIKQRKDAETQALTDIQNDFATALGEIEAGHKKLVDVIGGFFNSLTSQFEKLANQEIANQLFGANPTAGSAGGAGGGGLLASLFGGGGGGGGGASGTGLFAQAIGWLGSFDEGISYVPRTGLAVLHSGERVLTRQENMEGGNQSVVHVHNNFNVQGETTYESRAAIASQVGRSMRAAQRNL